MFNLVLLVLLKSMFIYLKFFFSLISYYRYDEPKPKPTLPPPPPPPKTVVLPPSTTNISTRELTIPNRTESKSPSPQRIKVE